MKISAPSLLVSTVLALGISGFAQAKDLQPQEQMLISAGMSQAQVEQAIGKPARMQHFGLSNTTTWSYNTTDYFERSGDRIYEVDFGPNGMVISAGARTLHDLESRD